MMASQCIRSQWKLTALLDGFAETVSGSELEGLEVGALTLDSRDCAPGALFLACAGTRGHGMEFAAQAVAKGAVCIAAEPSDEWTVDRLNGAALQLDVPLVAIGQLSARVSELAARFYVYPAKRLRIVGVTGTNGKTTVSQFLARALRDDWRCGVLGTLGYGFPEDLQQASHTTPDAVSVQSLLARLHAADARAVAMEVSSHALHQGRVAAVPYHTAVFTNLSRDHLDYHGDMASYAAAKSVLFQTPGLAFAVVNADDPLGRVLLKSLSSSVTGVAVGRQASSDDGHFLRIDQVYIDASGVGFEFRSSWGAGVLRSGLIGEFNIENLALSLAVLLAWGLTPEDAVSRLHGLPAVSGRMEAFGGAQQNQPLVVVDYAHTPDALEKALQALRRHTPGELTCVFGCGGDRDRGKRSQMGRVAEGAADRVILTDDNPRDEDGDRIIADIQQGLSGAEACLVMRQRAQAIRHAVQSVQPGDTVLVAGKGHEDYQLVGDLRLPFSDVEQVQAALQANSREVRDDA